MPKIPKFLICQNTQAITDEPFILHTDNPKFLCKVLSLNPFKVEILDDFNQSINLEDYPFLFKRLKSIAITHKNLFK